jgi:hypothetical protein
MTVVAVACTVLGLGTEVRFEQIGSVVYFKLIEQGCLLWTEDDK